MRSSEVAISSVSLRITSIFKHMHARFHSKNVRLNNTDIINYCISNFMASSSVRMLHCLLLLYRIVPYTLNTNICEKPKITMFNLCSCISVRNKRLPFTLHCIRCSKKDSHLNYDHIKSVMTQFLRMLFRSLSFFYLLIITFNFERFYYKIILTRFEIPKSWIPPRTSKYTSALCMRFCSSFWPLLVPRKQT